MVKSQANFMKYISIAASWLFTLCTYWPHIWCYKTSHPDLATISVKHLQVDRSVLLVKLLLLLILCLAQLYAAAAMWFLTLAALTFIGEAVAVPQLNHAIGKWQELSIYHNYKHVASHFSSSETTERDWEYYSRGIHCCFQKGCNWI